MHNFTSFTAETMGAFRQAIRDANEQRIGALARNRETTRELLAESHRSREAAEAHRRSRAAHDSGSRETFVDALRMEVETIKDGFHTRREEIATELREMADELKAAQAAFRDMTGTNRR